MKKIVRLFVILMGCCGISYADGLNNMTNEPAATYMRGNQTARDTSSLLIWNTSKTDVVSMAKNQGKKILLLAGRETCGLTMYMRNTVCESTVPPVRCLIEQNFVTWFCDVDSSTDWYPYANGLGSFTLPLICTIDPDNSSNYLDRTTAAQEPEEFYSRLKTITGSDCVSVTVSGYVKDSNGNGITDVMINFSNNGGLAKTDGTGFYTHNVISGWSGNLTPYKIGYTFNPLSLSLNSVVSNLPSQNYTADIKNDPYILEIYHTGRLAGLIMTQGEFDAWNGETSAGYEADRKKISKYLYTCFKDDFHYVFLISNNEEVPYGLYYGNYQSVKNSVKGIGQSLYDSTTSYGSSGRLHGIMHISYRRGLKYGPTLHEIMHEWGNYIVETSYTSHWGFSSGSGQLGGFKLDTLRDLGGGIYQANNGKTDSSYFGENANGGNSLPYSDIELYLMGMIDKTKVSPLKVAVNPQWIDFNTGKFSATDFIEYTMEDIVQKHGERIPSTSDSQKTFKALVVILTPQPLSEKEWQEVDQHVTDFSLTEDDGNPYNYNFWEATRGLATITMDNINNSQLSRSTCDINGDKVVDLRDTIISLEIVAGIIPSSVTVYKSYDVNGDGKIGIEEVLCSMQIVAGIRH